MTCPGCAGPISRRAKLCADCRKRANAVGASVVTHVAAAAPRTGGPLRTPQQSQVFHGKLNDLAKRRHVEQQVVKRHALAHAAATFGRPIASSTELTEIEMELLLEWLDEELAATAFPIAAVLQ